MSLEWIETQRKSESARLSIQEYAPIWRHWISRFIVSLCKVFCLTRSLYSVS